MINQDKIIEFKDFLLNNRYILKSITVNRDFYVKLESYFGDRFGTIESEDHLKLFGVIINYDGNEYIIRSKHNYYYSNEFYIHAQSSSYS